MEEFFSEKTEISIMQEPFIPIRDEFDDVIRNVKGLKISAPSGGGEIQLPQKWKPTKKLETTYWRDVNNPKAEKKKIMTYLEEKQVEKSKKNFERRTRQKLKDEEFDRMKNSVKSNYAWENVFSHLPPPVAEFEKQLSPAAAKLRNKNEKKKQQKVQNQQMREFYTRMNKERKQKKDLHSGEIRTEADFGLSPTIGLDMILKFINPFKDMDILGNCYVKWMTFAYQCYRSRNVTDVAAACVTLSGQFTDLFSTIWKSKTALSEAYAYVLHLCTQSSFVGKIADKLEGVRDFFNKCYTGELLTALRDIMLSVVSFSIFKGNCVRDYAQILGPLKRGSILDLSKYTFDAVISFLRAGDKLILGSSLRDLLFNEDPIKASLSAARELLPYKDRIYGGLPVEGRMDRREFIQRADELFPLMEMYMKSFARHSYEYKEAFGIYNLLKVARVREFEIWKSSERITPYGIILHGTPHIGKGKLLNFIGDVYSKCHNRDFHQSHVYHRTVTSPYWDTYQPLSQPIIHYSEPGGVKSDIVRNKGDPMVAEVCSLIDSIPYPVDVAECTLKGSVFARPELVIADTNCKDLNLEVLVNNPAAHRRRFLYVEPIVKPEFRIKDSVALDSAKSIASEVPAMDRWTFKVSRMIPVDSYKSVEEHLMYGREEDDIYAFTKLLSGEMKAHFERQEELLARTAEMTNSSAYMPQEPLTTEVGPSPLGGATSALYEFVMLVLTFIAVNLLYWSIALVYRSYCQYLYIWLCVSKQKLYSHFYFHTTRREGFQGAEYRVFHDRRFYWCETEWWVDNRKRIAACVTGFVATLGLMKLLVKYYEENNMPDDWVHPQDRVLAVDYLSTEGSKFLEEESPLSVIEEAIEAETPVPRKAGEISQLWNPIVREENPALHTGSAISLSKSLSTNTRRCQVQYQDTFVETHILGICKSYALINTHALPKGVGNLTVAVYANYAGSSSGYTFPTLLTELNRVDMEGDLTLLRLHHVLFSDIMKHIKDDYPLNMYKGALDGFPIVASRVPQALSLKTGAVITQVSNMWSYNYAAHYEGFCGHPLVLEGVGSGIVGIHTANQTSTNICYAAPIDKSKLLAALGQLNEINPFMELHNKGVLNTESFGDPVVHSPFLYEPFPALQYYGKEPGNVMFVKNSDLKKTPYWQEIQDILYYDLDYVPTTLFGKPLMRSKVEHGEYISPVNIGLRKMSKDKIVPLNDVVMKKVIDKLVDRFTLDTGDLKPLTIEDAINGIPGDPFYRRINVTTAGGYGFHGKKREYLPIWEETDEYVIREPVELLKERLEFIFTAYQEGNTSNVVYKACLKDEPRDMKKVRAGKTRLFYASPIDSLIVCKMLLAPFYTDMMANPNRYCSTIGINMHTGADSLVKNLTEFSEHLDDGDFGSFDLTIPYEVGLAACSVISKSLEKRGYNSAAMNLVRGTFSDSLFFYITLNKDMFFVRGMQPSGRSATAEDNCIRLLVLLMYFWYSIPELEDKDFFKYVNPKTYGDDLLRSVASSVRESFSNQAFQTFCESVYGMTYTPAIKDSEMGDSRGIEECSFLKRTFKFSHELGRWLAPLSLDSLLKSMQWYIPSKSVPVAEQLFSTCTSFMWELTLHVSEEKYDTIKSKVEELYAEHVFNGVRRELPSFFQIRNQMFPSAGLMGVPAVEPTPLPEISLLDHSELSEQLCQGEKDSPDPQLDTNSDSLETLRSVYERIIKNRTIKKLNDITELFNEPDSNNDVLSRISFYKTQQEKIFNDLEAIEGITKGMSLYQVQYTPMRNFSPELREACYYKEALLNRMDSLEQTVRFLYRVHDKQLMPHCESTDVVSENMLEVPGEGMQNVSAGEPTVDDAEGQVSSLDMGDYLSRPVQIYESPIPFVIDSNIRLSVWDLFSKAPPVRAKLRNFAYLKGNLKVRVSLSGSPFHVGRFLVSYQPYANYNANISQHIASLSAFGSTWRPMIINYLSQAEGAVTMNVNENRPVEVHCPFIAPKPMFRLFNTDTAVLSAGSSYDDLRFAGDLFIYTITPVTAVSTSPSTVYLQVYAWIEDAELGTNTATQIAITTESSRPQKMGSKDERVKGTVQVVAGNMRQIADKVSMVPSIGFYAKASSMMFGAVEGLAAHFGWSKPVLVEKPLIVKLEPFQNGALTIGHDTNKRIVLDPKQEVTVDPRIVGIDDDQMSISSICQRPSYLGSSTWAPGSTVMAGSIINSKVTPCLETSVHDSSYTYIQPSSLMFAATPFVFWRGDITYRFEVVCSAFHRGKLAIIYEPNVNQYGLITAGYAYNKQYIRIVDIQETNTFEVTVKWASPRPWLKVDATADAGRNFNVGGATGEGYVNGFITVVPFTQLQSPDGSSVTINTYVYSDNMRFNQFSQINRPRQRITPSSPPALAEIKTESGVAASMNPAVESVKRDLNESTATEDHISEMYFGEQPLSFRTLLKRYMTNYWTPYGGYGTDDTALTVSLREQIYPTNIMTYGSIPGVPPYFDLFSYLKYAYLGMRGGIKKRLHFTSPQGLGTQQQVKIGLDEPTNSFTSAIYTDLYPALSLANGSVTYVPFTVGGIEVEFPFYTNNQYLYAFNDDPTIHVAAGEIETMYTRAYTIQTETYGQVAAGAYSEEFAAAEDFSFLRFQGAPLCSAPYP